MAREYVENRDGGYYVIGSRVSLESVIFLFLDGASPETIVDEFPTLSLEQVYGAITFYLGNKAEAEEDIAVRKREEDDFSSAHPAPPEIKEKFDRMRQQALARRS